MTLASFIELAKKWNDLGTAVQEQVCCVLADVDTMDDQNPAALKMANDLFLRFAKREDDEEFADDCISLEDDIETFLVHTKESK